MADDGYLIGFEDSSGNFVEVGRFNNLSGNTSDPVFIEHTGSGTRMELDGSGFDMGGSDITNAGSVSTEKINNGLVFAGNYGGGDPDSRLDNAISDAVVGSEIRLERGTYSASRTVGDGYKFVGVGTPSNDGTVISGNWTLNGQRATLLQVRIDADLTTNGFLSKILFSGDSGGVTVTVGGDNTQIIGCSRFDIVFNSGTSGGIVDSGTGQSVTDNGANTTGDIA